MVLAGLAVIGAVHPSDRQGIDNILVAMATAAIIDLAVGLKRKNKRITPDGGMITGLIIGLVLSATVHWYVVALTAAIAVASKHLIKIGRKPVFNPAAFALLLTLLVYHTGQSWWGDLADLPLAYLPILFIGGCFITSRVNKWPQVMAYLGTYFLLLTLAVSLRFGTPALTPGDALRVPLVNAAFFMVFFMLTDPPTSPGKHSEQVTFSVLAAVVSVGIYVMIGGLSYLLIGLLAANGWRGLVAFRANRIKGKTSKNAARKGSEAKVQRESFV